MGKESSGQSFADYLKDAPLAPDTSVKVILTGEAKRSAEERKFLFSSPELGTVMLDVEAVREFDPIDGGLVRITLDADYVRDLPTLRAGRSSGKDLAPFVMATPHRASAAAIREQIKKAEMSAAILDVETAFIKDVWGDEGTDLFKNVSGEETLPASPFRF